MLIALLVVGAVALIAIDTFAALRARRYSQLNFGGSHSREDFAVLVPIYGDVRYLENVEYLSAYGNRVVLVTTNGETSTFYEALEVLSRQHGFRIFRSSYAAPQSKKRRTGGTIRDRIIRDALHTGIATAPYVVCIDADTATPRSLGELVGELAHRQADLASVRLVPQSGGSFLVRMQQYEYRIAMRLRFIMPWLVSGACHVGRTEVLRDVMSRHSLFFQGNDVEVGLLAKRLGYRVTHIPFEVTTNVPEHFRPWWRQRLAWAGGEVRLFVANIRFAVHHPFFWVYGLGIVLMLCATRWWVVAHPSLVLAAAALLYYVVILYLHWQHRSWWLALMPVYTLAYSLVFVPLGFVTYLMMSIPERNFGIIRPARVRV